MTATHLKIAWRGLLTVGLTLVAFQNCGRFGAASWPGVETPSARGALGAVSGLVTGSEFASVGDVGCEPRLLSGQTFEAAIDLDRLPFGCGVVPLEESGTFKGVRCASNSIYSRPNATKSCARPESAHYLISNGERLSIRVLGGANHLWLGSRTLQDQIAEWWLVYDKSVSDAAVRGNVAVLLANAYDQICRDALKRNRESCQFPFPDLQSSRRMALGRACPSGDVRVSKTLMSNGVAEAHQLIGNGGTHFPLVATLESQIESWVQEYGRDSSKVNIHILLQMAFDQMARCGAPEKFNLMFPEWSQFGGRAWMANSEDGPPSNMVANGNFREWKPDRFEIIAPDANGKGVYSAEGWYGHPGPGGAYRHVRRTFPAGSIFPGESYLRIEWLRATTRGEHATSPRGTFIEYNYPALSHNPAHFADQTVKLTFYVRAGQPVRLIPILWQSYGADPARRDARQVVILDGETFEANGDWRKIERTFRVPGTRSAPLFSPGWSSLGLDMEDMVGFSSFVEIAHVSLERAPGN